MKNKIMSLRTFEIIFAIISFLLVFLFGDNIFQQFFGYSALERLRTQPSPTVSSVVTPMAKKATSTMEPTFWTIYQTAEANLKATDDQSATETVMAFKINEMRTANEAAPARATAAFSTAQAVINSTQDVQKAIIEATQTEEVLIMQTERADNLLRVATSIPNLTASFEDEFNNNNANGWIDRTDSMLGTLQIETGSIPDVFIQSCKLCGKFEGSYSLQVSVRIPTDAENVGVGIAFGSPQPITNKRDSVFLFEVNTIGDAFLEKYNPPFSRSELGKWYEIVNLKDGLYHTLQVIVMGKEVTLVIDKQFIAFNYPVAEIEGGYIGLFISSADSYQIEFDNLSLIYLE